MELIIEKIKRIAFFYIIELSLIAIAVSICVLSLLVYLRSSSYPIQSLQTRTPERIKVSPTPDIIYVEIAGAVEAPGIYPVEKGSRVNTLIEKAGGLAIEAQKQYIDLYLNRALILEDQQKLFIPRDGEVIPTPHITTETQPPAEILININTASASQLEELPSIGPVTAQEIISGRPYTTIQELVEKKVISASLLTKIKDSIYSK